MAKRDYIDFQDRTSPLGYLIHFSVLWHLATHGSTPYLWTDDELRRAIDYVINGQGDEPFR